MKYSNRAGFLKAVKSSSPDHLSRVYLVAVGDDFERAQVIASILRYLETPERSVAHFSGADFSARAFYEHMQTTSLFGGEPIAVLDGVEKLSKADALALLPVRYGYLVIGSRGKTPLTGPAEKEGVVLDALEEKPWEKEKRLSDEVHSRAANAGKTLAPDAAALFFEQLDRDSAVLISEIDKLICYTGDRTRIEARDVLAISASNKSYTNWQTAEELVWEGRELGMLDEGAFHALVPSLRSQLQLGLKIACLLEKNAPREEWSEALPRVFPKTLEKRTTQAARLGRRYFHLGLKALFEIELQSRTGSQQYAALLDLFRTKLMSYAPR